MTAFEQWVTETVKLLVRDMRAETDCSNEAPSSANEEQQHRERWDDIERCAAILLVQARAKEARSIETSMSTETLAMVCNTVGIRTPPEINFAKQIMGVIRSAMRNRSRDLEQMGLAMAKPEGWPFRDDPEPPKLEIVK